MTTDPPKINLTLDPAKQTLDLSNVRITATANPASIGLGNDGRQIVKDYVERPAYTGSYEVTPTKSTQTLATNGLRMTDDVTVYPFPDPTLQTKPVSITPTESSQSSTVTADAGYDGLDEVDVSVGAISSTYVGSAIDRRDSSDLTASGDTVSVPSGFYENAASKAVAGGTEGTPTATKGTVSNHSVPVTPSVTNTAGYITGSTKTGTPVMVSASELVSGTKSITSNGTGIDVTEYEKVDVSVSGGSPVLQTKTKSYTPTESQQTETVTADVGYDGLDEVDVTVNAISSTYVGSGITRRDSTDLTKSGATINVPAGYYENNASKSVTTGTAGTPTASKGAVSNHSISVTPSVTNTSGYITGSTITGTAVAVSASELVSGTKSITANGTGIDVTAYAAVDVSVSLSNSDAILSVTVPTGSSVSMTKGGVTLTPTIWTTNADNTLDVAIFVVPVSTFDSNAWTVTATLGAETASGTIVIDSAKEFAMELRYRFYVYKAGDQSGWTGVAWKYESGSSFSAKVPAITYGQTDMVTHITSAGTFCGMTYNSTKIDFTDYTTLRLTGSFTGRITGANGLFVFPTPGSGTYISASVAKQQVTAAGTQDFTVDVSSITGEYYVGVGMLRYTNEDSVWTVTGVWLV